MSFDDLSMCLTVASLILGPLTVIIVGSQTREDARSVATWTLPVLVPILLVSCARLAIPERPGGLSGALGMVVLCSGMIAALGLGYRIATLRRRAPKITSKGKKVEPGLSG